MIIAKAPFRISLAGGGSDLASYYRRNEYGAVISSSIDKYMYIVLHSYFEDKIRIKYSKLETVETVDEIKHPIVREMLRMHGIQKGCEIASISDVPAGTGLGSSSSFAVALTRALHANRGVEVSPGEAAENACHVEINVLSEPIGKQDQYAASFGGLNYVRFDSDETVHVTRLDLSEKKREQLSDRLILFYTGIQRSARDILNEQNQLMSQRDSSGLVARMVSLCDELRGELESGNIDSLGDILNEGWRLKKDISPKISSSNINSYYDRAIEAGADGGKLLGAGGGGFLLFYCNEDKRRDVVESIGLRELCFNLTNDGASTHRLT